MEKVKINKALTSKDATQVPNAPSLTGYKAVAHVTPIPTLSNFLKNYVVTNLEKRKAGIYKLQKVIKETEKRELTYLVLTYKLGKTKYKITSCKKVIQARAKMEIIVGSVTIIKSLFERKELTLNELPKNIVDSINDNIIKFNGQYTSYLVIKANAEHVQLLSKKNSFFNGLDL